MPLFSTLLTWLALVAAPDAVILDAPDPVIVERLEWAKGDLAQDLICADHVSCDDVAIKALALTALGRFDLARPALVRAQHRTALWVIASHAYWNGSGDQAFLREQWPFITEVFFTPQPTSAINDGGVLLRALDALLAMARAVNDTTTHTQARALYGLGERRAQEQPGLIAPAFGMMETDSATKHLAVLTDSVHNRWPLATGLLALGHYEYHRATQAFALLRTMAVQNASSSAMYVLPLVRGLIGWETDAAHNAAALDPHLPAEWDSMTVANLMVGQQSVSMTLRRDAGVYSLQLLKAGSGRHLAIQIAPALPAGARVRSVIVNDSDVPIHVEANQYDTHVIIETILRSEVNIEIEFEVPRNLPLPR